MTLELVWRQFLEQRSDFGVKRSQTANSCTLGYLVRVRCAGHRAAIPERHDLCSRSTPRHQVRWRCDRSARHGSSMLCCVAQHHATLSMLLPCRVSPMEGRRDTRLEFASRCSTIIELTWSRCVMGAM